jgi:hypothetical protein
MMAATIAIDQTNTDRGYERFIHRIGEHFEAEASGPLFETEAEGLWEKYLDGFDPSVRQYHNCHACRAFIERCGGLVTIDEHGAKHSAIWNGAADGTQYEASFAALREAVERPSARVTGVFLSATAMLGDPQKGIRKSDGEPWSHLCVRLPPKRVYTGRALTAGQATAEKAEDVKNVTRALGEFPLALLDQAVQLLKSDALYRSEKVLGPVEWLRNLSAATGAVKDQRVRANLIWRAVADAPAGFCHPRSSMAGTLLEDLETGRGFEWAAERFRAKMHPLAYQRPQAAPSAGQIEAAEKLVEKLGIARALERRFARLDELETVWIPTADVPAETAGVFGHLRPDAAKPASLVVPAKAITWAKFVASVLPEAQKIEVNAPNVGAYCAITTALHNDAPPIHQWDRDDQRNPCAWYLYNGGSYAHQWRVTVGWHAAAAISMRPSRWHGGTFEHQGNGAIFVLPGCVDTRENSGNALFPETLRSELHGARSVIEAYSKRATIHGRDEASACGLLFDGERCPVHVRVNGPAGVVAEYKIDRWE